MKDGETSADRGTVRRPSGRRAGDWPVLTVHSRARSGASRFSPGMNTATSPISIPARDSALRSSPRRPSSISATAARAIVPSAAATSKAMPRAAPERPASCTRNSGRRRRRRWSRQPVAQTAAHGLALRRVEQLARQRLDPRRQDVIAGREARHRLVLPENHPARVERERRIVGGGELAHPLADVAAHGAVRRTQQRRAPSPWRSGRG